MIRGWRKLKTKEMFKGRKIIVAVMSQRVEVPATLFFLSNAVLCLDVFNTVAHKTKMRVKLSSEKHNCETFFKVYTLWLKRKNEM